MINSNRSYHLIINIWQSLLDVLSFTTNCVLNINNIQKQLLVLNIQSSFLVLSGISSQTVIQS